MKDKLRRLEQSLGEESGPPPQEYYDARARRTRFTKTLMALALGQEPPDNDLDFAEHYRSSALKESDGQLIERHTPPRSPEDVARVRAALRRSLDNIAAKRREHGL
ncbi:MAG: hypothetical protein M3N45_14570 [Actinomycetota bacterium]|nr:hypothetical protein [Actinomycetota bacterium]